MNFVPQLRKIKVPLKKLLLDPNNPRFLEDHVERVDEKNFHESGVQIEAFNRMDRGAFHLAELKKSIETNGWQPVDMIFVRKNGDHFVVLEGNRRLMALRALGEEGKLVEPLKSAVDPLPVLEVVDEGDAEELRNQIAYLLGVRHQSSLKRWGPFAQAHDIYGRYVSLGKMTDGTFQWDDALAAKVGAALSVDVKKIQERLRVYRAMRQLYEVPAIKKVGMAGHYYTLVKEAVDPRGTQNPLRSYIVQDPSTFLLSDESIRRMDAVCGFSIDSKRTDAPVANPDEWRPLSQILGDPDVNKRDRMIKDIEVNKKKPSEVYAERQAELRQPRWDRWLDEVTQLLRKLQIANLDSADASAKAVGTRLAEILDGLPSPKIGKKG
jgi:hypothetical protein